MQATVTFALPEESDEFRVATEGMKWRSVVWTLNEWLRQQIKYQNRNEFEAVRKELFEELESRGLTLDF